MWWTTSRSGQRYAGATGEEVDELVHTICQEQSPATVLIYEPRLVLDGRFHGTNNGAIVLRVYDLPDTRIPDHILCNVSFRKGGKSGTFLTALREVLGNPSRLVLEMPHDFVVVEARRSFRVRVVPQADVNVLLRTNGATYRPRLADISMGGAQVVFDHDDPDSINAGSTLRLHVVHNRREVSLDATVVRRSEHTCGLAFDSLDVPSRKKEREKLGRILAALEEAWREHAGEPPE